jgi:hypothetical protein
MARPIRAAVMSSSERIAYRNQVQVEVQDVLTAGASVRAEDVYGVRTHRALESRRNAFCQRYAMCGKVVGQIEECWVVVFGYNERMTAAHRLNVQERNGPVVLMYDAHHFFAADYATEDTALVYHTLSSCHQLPETWRLILQDARRASQIPNR